MIDPAERLKIARIAAGYETAISAAEALGEPVSTYLGHENGSRGITVKKGEKYAKKFKMTAQWLLYGLGPGPGPAVQDNRAELLALVDNVPPTRRREAIRYLRFLSEE